MTLWLVIAVVVLSCALAWALYSRHQSLIRERRAPQLPDVFEVAFREMIKKCESVGVISCGDKYLFVMGVDPWTGFVERFADVDGQVHPGSEDPGGTETRLECRITECEWLADDRIVVKCSVAHLLHVRWTLRYTLERGPRG